MRIIRDCHAHLSALAVSDYTIRLGKAMREEMARRRETQAEAASRFGVRQSNVSRVLAGYFSDRSDLAAAMIGHYLDDPHKAGFYAHDRSADAAFGEAVTVLEGLWDGSVEGARSLKTMLKTVKWFRDGP